MGRKKKYKNAKIVSRIISREFLHSGNMQASIAYRFLDLKKKDDREFLKKNINEMMKIFNDALKELENT